MFRRLTRNVITMSSPWQGLLSSMAVVGSIASGWTYVRTYLPAAPFRQSLIFGAFMGAGAVLSMLTNFEAQPGIYFDLRTALISVAGFFGGPAAGLLAAIAAGTYRLMVGGVGASAGAASIVFVAMIGIFGGRLVIGRQTRERDVVALAAATAVSALATLPFLPPAARIVTLPFILGPGMCMIFSGTLLAGLALLHENRLREALRSNLFYRAIVEMLPDSLNFKDSQGFFTVANDATARLMRAKSPEDLIGKSDINFYPEEVAHRFRMDEEAIIADGAPKTIEQQAFFADGSATWLSTLKAPVRDDKGQIVGLITLNRDVSEQKKLQDALRIADGRLQNALEAMADGLVLFNSQGIIQFCNPQYRRLFPVTADLRTPGAALPEIIRQSIQRGEAAEPETDDFEGWLAERCQRVFRPGDRTIHLSDDRWIEARTRILEDGGSLTLFTDITARKRAEDALTQANEELARLALVDGLTGLTNRRGFDLAFEKEFKRGAREGDCLGVLIVDVDNFKAYNDAYGHQSGDQCLQAICKVLHATLRRPADLAARLGGEEFVALLPKTSAEGAVRMAEALRSAVKGLNLIHTGSDLGMVTISVGVAAQVPGRELKRAEDLLRRADKALYVAKAGGRDQVRLDIAASGNGPSIKLAS